MTQRDIIGERYVMTRDDLITHFPIPRSDGGLVCNCTQWGSIRPNSIEEWADHVAAVHEISCKERN